MDWEIIYLIGVILLALVLFIKEYVSIDITAIIVAVLLMASGIVTLKQGLSGFSNEAALAILALLILGTGLESTGLIAKISGYVARFTGNSAWGILIVMLPVVAVLSAFTNNTAVVTIFLPIILSISNLKKVSASKLLMPMAFISILGGVCTLIGTSTNLLVNSIARQYEIAPFSFFEFTKIGLVLLGIGILYAILFQHRLLPARRKYIKLEDEYQLQKYLMEIRVLEGSGLVGDFPSVNNILKEADVLVMKHVDSNGTINFPYDDLPVAEGDKLLVQVDPRKILDLKQKFNVSIQKIEDREILESDLENQLIEVVVTPGSWLVKKRIKSIDFTDRYDAVPLGISHSGKDIEELGKIKIKAGDTLLLETNQNIFNTQAIKNDFVLLNQISTAYSVKKRIIAVVILVGVVAAAALGLVPIVVSALAGCVLMFVTGCIKTSEAYGRVDWRVYFLIAGIIPLGVAIQNTGLDNLIAGSFVDLTKSLPPLLVIMILYLFITLMTNILANNATALLMSPIVISIALQMDIDPHALLLTVILAASTSFFTPVGYHTLTLIYGPGKYRFKDYLIAGLPLTIIIWIVASLLINYHYITLAGV